ncbi:ATP-binding protein [Streptomyces sp. UNOB3_S3]|uniref:ATP-binding protein n=1 Tax=Streptomyces sp. UNOB3_S3 TaxID=2871682 RepID=UPI001E60B78C|nr:ATP-binding protein [Streptomyces sp. UNOB3_S3]MCC3778527.1 ATP-binding protein [Streptomyces sp. UNOB3_S3]
MATVSPENRWSYSLTLPHDPRSARIARLTLRGAVESHGMGELADVTELVVSELVTNSYLYSDGPTEVRLKKVTDERVRISVWDGNPEVPSPFERPVILGKGRIPEIDPEAPRGRGLRIVRLCADNWGSWSGDQDYLGVRGKLLWCEVSPASMAFAVTVTA